MPFLLQIQQVPENFRTMGALRRTMVHLRGIMDRQDMALVNIHKYLWDRFRGVRQDLFVQGYEVSISCAAPICRSLWNANTTGSGTVPALVEVWEFMISLVRLGGIHAKCRVTHHFTSTTNHHLDYHCRGQRPSPCMRSTPAS